MNKFFVLIIYVALRVTEEQTIPKTSCHGLNPFKSKDDDCLNFSHVCIKNNDPECISFLDSCNQCPPTNASIIMQRDLFSVVTGQSNSLNRISDYISANQNKSTNSVGKDLEHIAGNVRALIGIIIFLLILMIIMMLIILVEVRFKFITKTCESKKRGKRFYRDNKTKLYKSYEPVQNRAHQDIETTDNKIDPNADPLQKMENKIESRFNEMQDQMNSLSSKMCKIFDTFSGHISDIDKSMVKFKLDGEEKIIELPVKCTDNIVKLKRKICEEFPKEKHYDYKSMKMEYNGELLDDNEYLFPRIVSSGMTIECKMISPSSSSSDMLVLKLETYNEDKLPEWIQVDKNESIGYLMTIIRKTSNISNVVIFKETRELQCEEKIEKCGLSDEDRIIVISKQCGILVVNFTFEKKDPIVIEYTNIDPVSHVKDILSKVMQVGVNDFILFTDNSYLDDKKFLFEYGIKIGSQIEYCSLRREQDSNDRSEFVMNYEFEDISYCKESKGFLKELIKYRTLKNNERFVQLHGLSFVGETLKVFMDEITNPLLNLIKTKPSLEISLIQKWAKQILEGLKCLHDKHIVYRDLKMSNILVDHNDNIKLTGFDLNKYVQGPDAAEMMKGMHYTHVSGIGFIRLAPEVRRNQHFGTYSDVWSLGVILFHLRKGKPLFSDLNDSTELTTLFGFIPKEIQGLTPVELRNFLSKCLIEQPEDRATVNILLEDAFLKNVDGN